MNEDKKSRILVAARTVFLRYGYRRVSMNDIAETAAVSRPALYLLFKNKEEIFVGVLQQWIDETIADVDKELASNAMPAERIIRAFDIWAVRPFEMMVTSPEASEIIECKFDFAQASVKLAYERFEASIAPNLPSLAGRRSNTPPLGPQQTAHVLASAVRGFKQTATTPAELRRLIAELLTLCFGQQFSGA